MLDMEQTLDRPPVIECASSRLRLRVTPYDRPPNPYGWEIYDEEDGLCINRSTRRYGTLQQAWEAGRRILDQCQNRSPLSR